MSNVRGYAEKTDSACGENSLASVHSHNFLLWFINALTEGHTVMSLSKGSLSCLWVIKLISLIADSCRMEV